MINMNAVTIESAKQKDYASWLPLWINYQTFYRTIISDEVTKLTWERFFTPSEPVYCAVAKYDGKIVGLVHYLFHRSTWQNQTIAISKIYLLAKMYAANTSVNNLSNMSNNKPKNITRQDYTGIRMKPISVGNVCMTGWPKRAE